MTAGRRAAAPAQPKTAAAPRARRAHRGGLPDDAGAGELPVQRGGPAAQGRDGWTGSARSSTPPSTVLTAPDGLTGPPTRWGRLDDVRFLSPPAHDLTYSDVFMAPNAVGRRLPARRRPGHQGRQRHHDPARGRQHDRGGRAPDGRDRGPPRRDRRDPAPGHPGRRGRRGHRLGQGPRPGPRHAAHARARHDTIGARAEPAAQAGPRRGHRGRRRRPPGRRGHRGRLHRRGPVHPALPRDVGEPADPARRDSTRSEAFDLLHGGRHRLAPVVDE